MSSADKIYTEADYKVDGPASELRIAIVRSVWNEDITSRLLDGALKSLHKFGISDKHIKVIDVPGSFELSIGAQMLLQECDPLPAAVICLGCVIKGETSHYQYINQTTAMGLKDVALKFNVPVIFGVLTDDSREQSLARSGGALGNKGEEAAITAVQMGLLQRRLRR